MIIVEYRTPTESHWRVVTRWSDDILKAIAEWSALENVTVLVHTNTALLYD